MNKTIQKLMLADVCPKGSKGWIEKNLLYAYPIDESLKRPSFNPGNIGCICLFSGSGKPLRFEVSRSIITDADDLRSRGMPFGGSPDARSYLLFSLKPFARNRANAGGREIADSLVPAKLDDYAKTDNDRALLSHWLRNGCASRATPYAERAKELLPGDLFALMSRREHCVGETVQQYLFPEVFRIPFPPPPHPKFTFIDLFAGIGGIRLAYQSVGGKCVFSSEWDQNAAKTYEANFGETPFGDITKIPPESLPDFDLLLAGFPCQPFSIIGAKKGFEHETQGTLFFSIEKILLAKKPKAFMLENVRNLTAHDHGRTFKIIISHLEQAGYDIHCKVLNALDYGVPQKRERIIICGFKHRTAFKFPASLPKAMRKTVADILDPAAEDEASLFVRPAIRDSRKERMKNKAFPLPYISHENVAGSVTPHPYSCALRAGASANYILINNVRRPSARELLRIQGFPDEFKIVVPYFQLRHQAGNSVPVPMIAAVARELAKCAFPDSICENTDCKAI